jgi:hypothetical protein
MASGRTALAARVRRTHQMSRRSQSVVFAVLAILVALPAHGESLEDADKRERQHRSERKKAEIADALAHLATLPQDSWMNIQAEGYARAFSVSKGENGLRLFMRLGMLEEAELKRAKEVFGRYGVAPEAHKAFKSPTFDVETTEEAVTMVFGRDIVAATDVAQAVLFEVFAIPSDRNLSFEVRCMEGGRPTTNIWIPPSRRKARP